MGGRTIKLLTKIGYGFAIVTVAAATSFVLFAALTYVAAAFGRP